MVETPTPEVDVSLPDDEIDILNMDSVEASPTNQVFRTATAILALVRDEMGDSRDSVQLSEYFSGVYNTLETAVQGNNADDLGESVKVALGNLERVTGKIERTLRRSNTPNIEFGKGDLEEHKLEIQKILGTLKAPPNRHFTTTERDPYPAPAGSHDTATAPVSESACGRLIRRAFAPHELSSLIKTIFSRKDEGDAVRRLVGEDVQTFVDVIDEALDNIHFSSRIRKKCLKSLYRTCGHHALLPKAMKVVVRYDRTGVALYRGGFADVWKGEHCGREVAVKVLRTYSNSDLRKVVSRFCKEVVTWKALRHPNILPLIGVTMSENQFAMVSDWMVNGNINDFVKDHPGANRLELLEDVASGLIYIHGQGMIHGDLKGANILIDNTGHARLSDFGLLTVISDPTASSSYTQGGTARWMSPELIDPERFGFKRRRPTKPSDCYALGMVIYETISGNLPFHKHTDPVTVFMKVVEGERPPRGTRFAESLWRMLELCWAPQPNNRPSIEDVLQCLEMISDSSEPPSPGTYEDGDRDSVSGLPGDTIETERSATTSSGTSHPTDRPPSPVSTASLSSIVEAINDPDDRGGADPGPLASRTDSNDRGPHQDPLAISGVARETERPDFYMSTISNYQSSSTQGPVPEDQAPLPPPKPVRLARRTAQRPRRIRAKGPFPPPKTQARPSVFPWESAIPAAPLQAALPIGSRATGPDLSTFRTNSNDNDSYQNPFAIPEVIGETLRPDLNIQTEGQYRSSSTRGPLPEAQTSCGTPTPPSKPVSLARRTAQRRPRKERAKGPFPPPPKPEPRPFTFPSLCDSATPTILLKAALPGIYPGFFEPNPLPDSTRS